MSEESQKIQSEKEEGREISQLRSLNAITLKQNKHDGNS